MSKQIRASYRIDVYSLEVDSVGTNERLGASVMFDFGKGFYAKIPLNLEGNIASYDLKKGILPGKKQVGEFTKGEQSYIIMNLEDNMEVILDEFKDKHDLENAVNGDVFEGKYNLPLFNGFKIKKGSCRVNFRRGRSKGLRDN